VTTRRACMRGHCTVSCIDLARSERGDDPALGIRVNAHVVNDPGGPS
jgi:hypothetical protein